MEGALALVEFPDRGGRELAEALGYRVESVFDIWHDLEMPRPRHFAGFRRVERAPQSAAQIEDGLAPARVARLVAEYFLADADVPQPPHQFDHEYDGRGGVYVSFRDAQTDRRLARDDFWHFEPAAADVGRDVVLATLKTLRSAAGTLTSDVLPQLKIAVTFFGPLERVAPRQLDFDRYGIVVRSRAWETKIGGALPNTEVFTSEIEQYHHARVTNAKIGPFEPHDLYRHTVVKCPEQDASWLRYGVPDGPESDWTRCEAIGARLTQRAREILLAPAGTRPRGDPLPDDLIEAPLYGLAVTLYHRGTLGCAVAWQGSLEECVKRATIGAANDERFRARRDGVALSDVSISVSVLHDREWLGELSIEHAARKLRLGLNSVAVQQGNRRGILLAFVAPFLNWTKRELAKQVLRKARIAEPPYVWCTFKTATWVAHNDVRVARFGFVRSDCVDVRHDIRLLAGYIMNSRSGGLPRYCYFPVAGTSVQCGSAARVIHALIALHEAGRLAGNVVWSDAARDGLLHCLAHVDSVDNGGRLILPGYQSGAMADCQLLVGISLLGPDVTTGLEARALAERVAGLMLDDGRIAERRDCHRAAQDHDFLPGAALWSLARFRRVQGDVAARPTLNAQFEWYRRRFRLLHRWGLAGWHMQAWSVMHDASGDARYADFVFEMADWALEWQLEKNGAFVTDLYPSGPSFHTAFVAEGIAAAWRVARDLGDRQRAARYAHACHRAASFMSELVIRPSHDYCLRDPARAAGGVRAARDRSDVRIDFVSHALFALVTGPDAEAPVATAEALG